MSEPEPITPAIRVQDRCAWCGHALSVVTRSWVNMSSDAGLVIGANYCDGKNNCAHPDCPKNCNIRAELSPDKVVATIRKRQEVLCLKEASR